MQKDKERWNKKYLKGDCPRNPSACVRKFYSLAEKGRALDIAAGLGRNARFLAEQGFEVDAVDISDIAMKALKECHPNVHGMTADLDDWEIPENKYSLIINIRYLNRHLFPAVKEALMPGGLLIFETFMEGTVKKDGTAFNRRHLLRENELLHAFLSLRILYYEEKSVDTEAGPSRMAALVAVKPQAE